MNSETELKSAGPMPRQVGEVMTREIRTLEPDQSFADVVSLLAGNSFHHIVIAVDGYLMGVLSDRDVYRQLGRVSDWSAKKVGEIMITNALTITPETLLSEAAEQMLSRRVNCLPVVTEAGKLVGLLTSTDIIRLFKALHLQMVAEL
jgi:acetoin utilization protein AcuB